MLPCLLLSGALALGGWGPSGCGPVGLPPVVGPRGSEWRTHPGDPGRSYLFRDGVQIAGYDHARNVYRPFDAAAGTWGPPQAPPWQAGPGRKPEAVPNFGVDLDKLKDGRAESYRLNGVPVTKEQACKVLEGGQLPDDADRPRLTVIGPPAATEPVVNDLARSPLLAEWKDRLVVQAYPPDHWAVARAGFVTGGRPTLYLQAPDGQVLHRQDDYDDGPAGLAQALRRADPNYDARKDPDLRRLPRWPRFDFPALPLPACLLAAGFLILVLRRPRA